MPSEDTQFKPGQVANPNGRPKGTKNKITLLKQVLEAQLRDAAKDRMPAVLDKAMELAMAGDKTMIKLLLELHMSRGHASEPGGVEKVDIHITTAKSEKTETETVASEIAEDIANVGQ